MKNHLKYHRSSTLHSTLTVEIESGSYRCACVKVKPDV